MAAGGGNMKTVSAAFAIVLCSSSVFAAEKFQQLTGAQILARLPGKEITDNVHSADVFAPGGALTSYAMSRKSIGKWRVQQDTLCLERGKDPASCHQVWMAGNKIELRFKDSTLAFFEGVLQRPASRK